MASGGRGTIATTTVYADAGSYASFPGIIRSGDRVVVVFQLQKLDRLRAIEEHPHWQKVAEPMWAVSDDRGRTWRTETTAPTIGKVDDATQPTIPLADGGTVTLSFHSGLPKYAMIAHGVACGYRPYLPIHSSNIETLPINDVGPLGAFFPFGGIRVGQTLIASGYASIDKTDRTTVVFLKSTDDGRSWQYLSCIDNREAFAFSEADILAGPGDRLQVFMRVDCAHMPKEQWPADAEFGEHTYGYYLYRAESDDAGRTWSQPVRLPLWGHPPCVRRLASGRVVMVYGQRRKPYGILAAYSDDDGATWSAENVRQIYTFDPGGYDLGYPAITQYDDGSILCVFYGYSSKDAPDSKTPHGIFAVTFDEAWLTAR